MRIAVSADTDRGLEALVSPHFGRCPYYTLVDVEGQTITSVKTVPNPYYPEHVPGVGTVHSGRFHQVPRHLAQSGVQRDGQERQATPDHQGGLGPDQARSVDEEIEIALAQRVGVAPAGVHRALTIPESAMAVKIAGGYLERATGPGVAWADGIMPIQAGAFWMGRDAGASDEGPMHRVYVRDFWLDRNKATNRELVDYFHRRDGRFTADPGFEDHPRRRSPGSAPGTTASGAARACPPGEGRPRGRSPPLPVGGRAAGRRADRGAGSASASCGSGRPRPTSPTPNLPDDRRARPVS